MALEKELSLGDCVLIVRRRWPYVLVAFFVLLLIALAITLKLPSVYRSTGTILIESQVVRPDLVGEQRESYARERIEVLKQLVLTRDNFYRIAKEYNLFDLDKKPDTSQAAIYNAMRIHTDIALLDAEVGQWGQKSTFAFQISFDYYDVDIPHRVANDIVRLFLDENEKASKTAAVGKTEFLSKEAERLERDLEKIEAEVTNYKRQYADSLPQNMQMQVTTLQRLETDLRATQREYSATQAELRALDVSLESAKAGVGLTTDSGKQTPASELEALKVEYAKLSGVYSENHPTLKALQRKINNIEATVGQVEASNKPVTTTQTIMVSKVQAQIDTANAKLRALAAEEESIRGRIRQVESLISRSSQTEGGLVTLMRDYENAKISYENVKTKLVSAEMNQNLELENKGERFVLVEAPLPADKPIKPNRILLLLGGILGSIVGAILLAILMEKFDKRIRGVDSITAVLKMQPLATIPYIANQAEINRKKYMIWYVGSRILLGIIVICVLVHFFVMPLDVLASKVIAKFN